MRHEPTSGHDDPTLNYRITWQATNAAGAFHERVFPDRDQGWDFYQDMQRGAGAYNVTWDHIPA